jgi:hypothetical protein
MRVFALDVPAIHVFLQQQPGTWMPGTSSAKTRFALLPGHDVALFVGQEITNRSRGGAVR